MAHEEARPVHPRCDRITFSDRKRQDRSQWPGRAIDVEKGFRPASEIAEAGVMTGTGTGGPVVAGTRFLAVAEVYAPIAETEGDQRSDIRKFDQITYHRNDESPPVRAY